MAEVKEKPAMYSYIANWQIPRAHWAEMEKSAAARKAILDKAMADGTIVGYGDDMNLVHTPDGETHDTWWSAMSMAGLVKVLDQLMAGERVRHAECCQSDQALGRGLREPLLQLEAGRLQGRLRARVGIQVEGRCARRCGRTDRAAPDCADAWISWWPTARLWNTRSTRWQFTHRAGHLHDCVCDADSRKAWIPCKRRSQGICQKNTRWELMRSVHSWTTTGIAMNWKKETASSSRSRGIA